MISDVMITMAIELSFSCARNWEKFRWTHRTQKFRILLGTGIL